MVGEHWINERYLRTPSLDVVHPAYLMFYPFGVDEYRLVGTAYGLVQPTGAAAPDGFTGDSDRWHVHLPCERLPVLRTTLVGSAAECRALGGVPAANQIAMLHVWLEPTNPTGPFAPDNPALPFAAVGLIPPTAAELVRTADAAWFRELGLALSETYGGTPRLSAMIAHLDSTFIRVAHPSRRLIQTLIPRLRDAQRHGDGDTYRRVGDRAIVEWGKIRDAYLAAAGQGNLGRLLEAWFRAAVGGDAHTAGHRDDSRQPGVSSG